MFIYNKRFKYILLTAALLLLIPFVAMQFTDEVQWDTLDFAVMGTLLFGIGISCELALRIVKNTTYRIIILAVLLLLFLLIWAELAVGIFGTPFAGN